MQDLESIDLFTLANVHGGQLNENNLNIGVTAPTKAGPVQVGVQAGQRYSDWVACGTLVKNMGGTPADIRSTCGLPPGGQQ